MIIKSLKVVLMTVLISSVSTMALATDKKKEAQLIENELNTLFMEAMKSAATELGRNDQVHPFAMMVKKDGTLGYFKLDTSKMQKMNVNEQNANIRKLLRDVAMQNQISSSIQVMYALVKKDSGEARQGLTFEIEHESGVSLIRFLPVSESKDKNSKWVIETESLSTASKPRAVFSQGIVE